MRRTPLTTTPRHQATAQHGGSALGHSQIPLHGPDRTRLDPTGPDPTRPGSPTKSAEFSECELPGGVGGSSVDRRHDVDGAELGDGRDLLNDVVAEPDSSRRHERARVAAVDGDWLVRNDVRAGGVVLVQRHAVLAQARRVRQHLQPYNFTLLKYKQLRYRRRTARRRMSVEIASAAAQQCRNKLYSKPLTNRSSGVRGLQSTDVRMGTLKMRDMNLRDMKMRHHVAGWKLRDMKMRETR